MIGDLGSQQNPTGRRYSKGDVIDFLRALERSVLDAFDRGDPVALGLKHYHQDIEAGPESGYNPGMILDVIYTGVKFTISMGEPALRPQSRATEAKSVVSSVSKLSSRPGDVHPKEDLPDLPVIVEAQDP